MKLFELWRRESLDLCLICSCGDEKERSERIGLDAATDRGTRVSTGKVVSEICQGSKLKIGSGPVLR